MDPFTIRQVLLVMHLSGLVLMTGTTAAEFVAFRTLMNLETNSRGSAGLLKFMSGLGKLLIIGGILLASSGIGLMAVTDGVYLHQMWLKLKLALILLLPLNGMLIGTPQMKRLRNSLSVEGVSMPGTITPILTKLNTFYTVQLLVFLVIVILAVFKFTAA
ncbi:DUF2214 family protein [Dyadobacter sp. CY326]|uniref:DUF2214 family protein n=1 Tax=Dyadobacter sp. CY326 TaxID=2907300 RepID=UPI001F2B7879|nr:DUF2214 family protein [Dyadobacter sp. CY326]MCE7067127.1 DUF2214 family protein [Dyadobacter sp. CY326]